jgi:YopX protein
MSRPIEFRAWIAKQPHNNCGHYEYSCDFDSLAAFFREDEDDEIEPWTGLYDKNKKKIFEGDVVKAWIDLGPGGEAQYTFVVQIDAALGCNIQPWNYKENGYLPEVLGNVHENPKLLKVANDRF